MFAAQERKKFAFFVRLLWSLLITLRVYLITLRSEKEINALENCLEKVLNFGSKNLYEPGLYLAKGTGIPYFVSAMKCCVSFSVLLSA